MISHSALQCLEFCTLQKIICPILPPDISTALNLWAATRLCTHLSFFTWLCKLWVAWAVPWALRVSTRIGSCPGGMWEFVLPPSDGRVSPSSGTPLGTLGVGASFSSSTCAPLWRCLELVAIGDKTLELMEKRSDPGWRFLCSFFRQPLTHVWPSSCIWQGYKGEVRTKFKPSCHMHQCLINYTAE